MKERELRQTLRNFAKVYGLEASGQAEFATEAWKLLRKLKKKQEPTHKHTIRVISDDHVEIIYDSRAKQSLRQVKERLFARVDANPWDWYTKAENPGREYGPHVTRYHLKKKAVAKSGSKQGKKRKSIQEKAAEMSPEQIQAMINQLQKQAEEGQ